MARIEVEHFRKNVAKLCAGYGEVQRIAVKAGITRAYLSKVIHGRATPSIDVALDIAEALELDLGVLFESPTKFAKHLPQAS